VSWPGGLPAVSAVAVAPDSHRVALLAGGQLYVTTLSNDNGVQLGAPILIQTVLTALTAVDWGAQGTLVVAGTNPDSRMAIMDVSVDGAIQRNRLADLGSNAVTSLTAYPANPAREAPGVPVAYVLNNAAYDESSTERIDLKDLAALLPAARPGVQPTAPFFLG
jgi:hypothetical protein